MKKITAFIVAAFLSFVLSYAQKSSYVNFPIQMGSKLDLSGSAEVVEARTERSAEYKFSDGRVVTENAFSPIHFRNKENKWQRITNRFVEQDGDVVFNEQKYPIRMNKMGWIAMDFTSSNSVSFQPFLFRNIENFKNLKYINNEWVVESNNLIQKLSVRNNAIKSSLFLTNAANISSSFYEIEEKLILPVGAKINFNKQKGKLDAGVWKGTVEILNEQDEVISSVSPAICTDANHSFYLAGYKIIQVSEREYTLKTIVDSEWLQSEERVFPVEIDPLITGPLSTWNGGYMPSCFMPQYNVDSLLVNVPAGITVTGLLVQASYYADPFTATWMSDGSMYFSTECGQTTEFTVTGANANLAGTAYLVDYDMRNPLMCCFTPSCSDQSFYLRMHLGRSFMDNGCNINYIYYDQFSLWPFTAYIEGHSIETFGSEWSVPNAATCTNNCSVTGTVRMKYGVPPYTITHPWMNGSIVTGVAEPCNLGNSSKQLQLNIPNCPDYCNTNPTLSIPVPIVTDACGTQLIGLNPASLNRKPAPDISFAPSNLVVCNNEPFDISVQSCLPNAVITWVGNGQSGSTSFTQQFFVSDTLSGAVTYNGFAELNGCYSDTVQYVVNVQPTVVANFSANPNPVVVNTELNLVDLSNAFTSNIQNVSWDLGNGETLNGSSVVYTYSSPGNYLVCVNATSENNCSNEFCETVQVVPATITPINIITPNGDGKNDLLEFQFLEFYPGNRLEVFNRWGKKIYEASPYLNNWNATDFSDGTYFYTLTVDEQQKIESDLFIKRD